jgi:malate dehydrogenase (oxaloacetate-decarboxylating)
MPALDQVRQVTTSVAESVALAALREGLATRATSPEEALQCLRERRWEPIYPNVLPMAEAASL